MQRRHGFTLIELVVVVMIIGILVAIAAPKLFYITGDASDNAARQSLSTLRDAIEAYASQNGGKYPGPDAAGFKTALQTYLRGPFPKCPVGSGIADGISIVSAGTALTGTGEDGSSAKNMWKYDTTSGEIIINYSAVAKNGTRYDNF